MADWYDKVQGSVDNMFEKSKIPQTTSIPNLTESKSETKPQEQKPGQEQKQMPIPKGKKVTVFDVIRRTYVMMHRIPPKATGLILLLMGFAGIISAYTNYAVLFILIFIGLVEMLE